MIATAENMEKILDYLKEEGVLGTAIISKNGDILTSDLKSNVSDETFALMMATILGAAQTVNTDLGMGPSNIIVIYSQRGKIIIATIGKKEFVAIITERNFNSTELFHKLEDINKRFTGS